MRNQFRNKPVEIEPPVNPWGRIVDVRFKKLRYSNEKPEKSWITNQEKK